MKVTLKQIAEKTGFSISTVSRSLTNSTTISKETRDLVNRAASELDYRPSAKKRRQYKKKKILHFALLSEFRIGEFYASLFCGYRDAAYAEDVRISLLSLRDQRGECVKFIQQILKDNKYDGLILFFPALERSHYDEILKKLPKRFPVVSNSLIDNPNIATITFDGYNGGRLAAEHLHKQGYRRLGIIEGPGVRPESRFRSNGFTDYIKQHADLELTWRYRGNFEFQAGQDAFRDFENKSHLLQNDFPASAPSSAAQTGSPPPGIASSAMTVETEPAALPADAVFASNDSMAAGFLEAAKSAGLQIPGDVAILGYDNLPAGLHREPQLSSIDTDFMELGVSSIKTLKNKIQKQGYKHGTLGMIPVRLMERESTVG